MHWRRYTWVHPFMRDTPSQTFTGRLFGAATLNRATYEAVEVDSGATGQAAAVGEWGESSLAAIAIRVVIGVVSWATWASVIVQVGGRLLPEAETRVSWPELLRTLGFGASPGLLLMLAGAPVVGEAIAWAVWFWMFAAMVVAVRQALDFEGTGRALLVCLIGAIIGLAVAFALSSLTATVVAR